MHLDLLFCNSFLQHNPTPLAGHRQENPEKKRVSEGWHRAILCSKQKPIGIICKWAYYMDKPFTNGKGRGYNAQNQRDRPGACAGSYPENHCGPCVGRSCPDRIFAKGKGSSARTFVRGRTPFLIRRVNRKRCLCIKNTNCYKLLHSPSFSLFTIACTLVGRP